MFTDNWKECFTNPLCNNNKIFGPGGLGGPDELKRIEAGTKEEEDKAFEEFFDKYIDEKNIVSLLVSNMVKPDWTQFQALFDYKVSKRIREAMLVPKNVECLFPG